MTATGLVDPHDYARHLAPGRGAIAVLAPVHSGARTLVVGTGWSALPRAIAALGGHVVGIDDHSPGLRYANRIRRPDREAYLCADPLPALPFADAAFDNVFLCDRIPRRERDAGDRADDDRIARRLAECRRVLRAGGTLVMEAPNRFGYLNWVGKADGGGRAELLPRRLAAAYLAARGRDGVVGRAHGHGRYRQLLEGAGFEWVRSHVPWPDALHWNRLWTRDAVRSAELRFDGARLRDRLARAGFRVLRLLRSQHRFVADYVFVARRPGGPAAPSVLECVLGAAGPDRSAPPVRSYVNSASVIVERDDLVYKVPLSRAGQARLDREREALRHVDGHPIAAFAVRPTAYHAAGDLRWVVYPRVAAWRDPERTAAAKQILDCLLAAAEPGRLDETDAWRRLFGPAARAEFQRFGAGPLLDHLGRAAGGKRLPIGLVHGDLALHNILTDGSGDPRLIDWDCCEPASPVLLDAIAASCFHAFRHLAGGGWGLEKFTTAWRLHLERDSRLPLLPEIERTLGELDWAEAITLGVLNQIHGTAQRDEHRASPAGTEFRAWIRLCEGALAGGQAGFNAAAPAGTPPG